MGLFTVRSKEKTQARAGLLWSSLCPLFQYFYISAWDRDFPAAPAACTGKVSSFHQPPSESCYALGECDFCINLSAGIFAAGCKGLDWMRKLRIWWSRAANKGGRCGGKHTRWVGDGIKRVFWFSAVREWRWRLIDLRWAATFFDSMATNRARNGNEFFKTPRPRLTRDLLFQSVKNQARGSFSRLLRVSWIFLCLTLNTIGFIWVASKNIFMEIQKDVLTGTCCPPLLQTRIRSSMHVHIPYFGRWNQLQNVHESKLGVLLSLLLGKPH